MEKFDKRKVSLGTYYLLRELGILPEKRSKERIVDETKELLKRLVEENTKTQFLAVSGNADPEFWNPLKEEIMNALSQGMKFFHCLGPIVCTDEEGKHVSIEAYKEFPNDVELWLSRTRNLYHLKCFSVIKTSNPPFHVYGECYHQPLANKREIYCISLESNDDPFLFSKTKYFFGQLEEFESLKVIRDRVNDVEKIPTITRYQLDVAYSKAKVLGKGFNVLNSEEILEILHQVL